MGVAEVFIHADKRKKNVEKWNVSDVVQMSEDLRTSMGVALVFIQSDKSRGIDSFPMLLKSSDFWEVYGTTHFSSFVQAFVVLKLLTTRILMER